MKTYKCLNCDREVKESEIVTNVTYYDSDPFGFTPEYTDFCPHCGCEFDFYIDEELEDE